VEFSQQTKGWRIIKVTKVLQGLSRLVTGHLGASVTRLPLGYAYQWKG